MLQYNFARMHFCDFIFQIQICVEFIITKSTFLHHVGLEFRCCIVIELKRNGRKKITLKLRKYARERLSIPDLCPLSYFENVSLLLSIYITDVAN